jgi:GcrA cell cycle regulator
MSPWSPRVWTQTRLACLTVGVIVSSMSWDESDIAVLKALWAAGKSAAQIARRLGCSRNAVCGRLNREGLKRGYKPPTAKPRIRPAPKRKPALTAACACPVAKKVSQKPIGRQPKEFSKRELYIMLAEAVRNTG